MIKLLGIFSVAVLVLAASQCAFSKQERHPLCRPLGGYEEDVCEVSMIRLLADPQEFDGKIVQVSGFFSDGPAPLLFVDEGAYSTSRTIDSILLKVEPGKYTDVLLRENRSFVIVIGRYDAKQRFIPEGASAERIGGSIAVSEAGRTIGPWGYSESSSLLDNKDKK